MDMDIIFINGGKGLMKKETQLVTNNKILLPIVFNGPIIKEFLKEVHEKLNIDNIIKLYIILEAIFSRAEVAGIYYYVIYAMTLEGANKIYQKKVKDNKHNIGMFYFGLRHFEVLFYFVYKIYEVMNSKILNDKEKLLLENIKEFIDTYIYYVSLEWLNPRSVYNRIKNKFPLHFNMVDEIKMVWKITKT